MADQTTASPTGFLDRQINTYGYPRPTRRSQVQQPTQQAVASPYMPNGSPAPAPAQQPQQYTGTIAQQPAPSVGTVDGGGVYHAGSAPTSVYTPNQIQQYQAQQQPYQGQLNQMLGGLLQNPSTYTPQVINQMKGQTADQAALLNRQSVGQLKAALAGRGIDPNSGYGLGQARALDAQMNSNILNQNRQLDIQANQQNHQDLLSALGLGNQIQGQQFNQGIQGYQAGLQGAEANRNEQLAAIQSQLANYNAGLQGQQLQSQSQLGSRGMDLQGQQLANQSSQFQQNFGLDTQKFDYQKQLDAQQLAMQQSAQSASNSQWADQMAFQYQKANQDYYNSLLSYMLSGGQ